jgi:hypothetical protein
MGLWKHEHERIACDTDEKVDADDPEPVIIGYMKTKMGKEGAER